MSKVRFTNGVSSIMTDLPVTRTWQAAMTGNAGEASIFVPYDNPAASALYIDPDGGSYVHVASEQSSGEWFGIVTTPHFTMTGLHITALQPTTLLGRRVVRRPAVLRNVGPGYLVSTALQEGLAGVHSLHIQYLTEGGGANVDEYDLAGKDLRTILSDMQERTGYETHVDAATGRVDWVGPLGQARRFGTLLVAGGNLRDWSYRPDVSERLAEAISTFEDEFFTVRNGASAVNGWPAQVTVSAHHQGELYSRAATTLAASSMSVVELTGAVTSDLWTIRERDTTLVLVPRAGFGGRFGRFRVLSRTLSDETGLMRLGFQQIQETAAGPQAFPQSRATRIGGRGRGRWGHRLVHLNRLLEDIARLVGH